MAQFLLHVQFAAEQPSHRFFSRRKAMQIAQSMPQGAMSVVLKVFADAMHGIMPRK